MRKFSIVTILIVVLGILFLIYYKEGTLPVNSQDKTYKTFVISRGESVNSIITNLHNQGLIRNKLPFFILLKIQGIDNSIQAGDFRLSTAMSAKQIAQELTTGTLDKWITIIEGLRVEEVANILAIEFGIPEVEFISQAEEGYLFPDTYLVPKEATLGAILTVFETNFNRRYSPPLREKAERLGFSDHKLLTLASLVEREANNPDDMRRVASVMLKRLTVGMPLQIDATVQYAIGYQHNEKSWWKKNLSVSDLTINSPYNTYKNAGLPPGPIASPGLAAIEAVLNADPNTPYLYYISGTDGVMHYGRNLEEHNKNIAKYLR